MFREHIMQKHSHSILKRKMSIRYKQFVPEAIYFEDLKKKLRWQFLIQGVVTLVKIAVNKIDIYFV